jgi:uncharacterized protein (TIGR03067 family)
MVMTRRSRKANPDASLIHLEDCWDEPPPGPPYGPADCERLQGAWTSTAGARQAALLVSGNHFTIYFTDGDIYMGSFELDVKGRPRAMKMRVEEGPARHKGQTALCFYEFDNGNMRWCTAGPGRTERPATFPPGDDPHYLCLVFRHQPRHEAL